ncbi:MAG TPA: polysaccharide deacetylase family protein [Candidatus Limnocylindrales bacterium]|nr:polysaccharide deacetylase family protein [Candidatus Limnocylindrales bacterium]
MARRLIPVLAVAVLMAVATLPLTVQPVAAGSYTVRLEAGPQTGYRFSASGTILGRLTINLASPATATSASRSSVPNRPGTYYRITTGQFAGYRIRESLVAYVPGKIGEVVWSPTRRITFPTGRYLGYRFDAAWALASTVYGSTSTTTTATASRRAIIDGRPYARMSSGPWSGTWMPLQSAGTTSAQRITCSKKAKVAPGSAALYTRVSTTDPQVALTFDMGGRMTPAVDIIERLVVDRVCATIFPTGTAAQTTDGRAVMALIKAHPELFEIGNHTVHHCNLRDGGGGAACPTSPPTASFIQAELRDADTVTNQLAGLKGVPYWRPPYGAHNAIVRAAAAAIGYTRTIMWDVDTIDWKLVADGGPTAGSMISKVTTNARKGSIVLMHLGGYHTFDALPAMVSRLRAAGLQPSTISALLRAG